MAGFDRSYLMGRLTPRTVTEVVELRDSGLLSVAEAEKWLRLLRRRRRFEAEKAGELLLGGDDGEDEVVVVDAAPPEGG